MEQLRTEDVCRYVGRLYLTSSQELDRVCAAYEVQIRQLKEQLRQAREQAQKPGGHA